MPTPVDLTDAFTLPPEVRHNWKLLAFGPDKKICIPVGSPCNLCEVNPGVHGQIRRYNLDGSGVEIVARGVRNSVGFDLPHAAALGMRFYPGNMFPAEYREAIFVARRGSWNRTEKNGDDVLTVRATADGKNAIVTPFVTGFLDKTKNEFWGRPVDVLQLPDGSMLIADEQMGAIYRVSYER